MRNFIAFDLEGPLSPNDHAYELMALAPGGRHTFEVLSRYDDLLALEGRQGYEPGDTLALIVPFLILYGITEADIGRLAGKATLTPGAAELLARLKARGWQVFIITTTYQPYAYALARRLSVPQERVAATLLPLDSYRKTFSEKDLAPIREMEERIAGLAPEKEDREIKAALDRFYWHDLKVSPLKRVLEQVRPVGGSRKVAALGKFLGDQPLREAVVVGDSITDFPMFQAVNWAGGLAVAFNANQYALPYATIGLAAEGLLPLEEVLGAWEEGGRAAAEALVRGQEKKGKETFQWLQGKKDLPLEIHRHYRRLLRDRAAELG